MLSKLDVWGWPAVVVLLSAALAGRAWMAWSSADEERRVLADAKADVDRLEAERDRLKGEIEALEEDPLYLESMLRRNRRVGPDEDVGRRP